MEKPEVRSWEGGIVSYPSVVVQVRSVDDIVSILKNSEKYPSPVRAVGSNHSTTRCGTAENGTVVNMTKMNQIIAVGPDTVTAGGGALYIDVSQELLKHDLQFYVNVEIGNMSMGSAACGGTKDASMPGEFGQVCSYATKIKLVTPSGELLEVTEDDPELLQIMRSSYGLLGIIYEVTFKVKPLRPMAVEHKTYSLDEFETQLPSLIAREESLMYYLFPHQSVITVEFRKYHDASGPPNRTVWKMRNLVWKKIAPGFGYLVWKFVPTNPLRTLLIDGFYRLIQFLMTLLLKSSHTIPQDQTIRYPDKSNWTRYTFSIWAFPEETFTKVLRAYFEFCQDYYRKHGYRTNVGNVGYRIMRDTSSLFSYSFTGNVMTADPVSTRNPGWEQFLEAYNEFCSRHNGVPLFNQSDRFTREQTVKAFGNRIQKFQDYRRRFDPTNRLLNDFFRELLD